MFQNAWYRPIGDPVWELPFRERDPITGLWHQGPRILRNFKPNHYLTRPHDGKRPGAVGRLKDALTGKGPDVFITSSANKRTLMRDRPQRWQWSGWGLSPEEMYHKMVNDEDFRPQDLEGAYDAPWTGKRYDKPLYNFRNRKHESLFEVWRHPDRVWTDARWPEGARNNNTLPLSVRDINYDWATRVPWWAGYFPGGRS